MRSAFFTIYVCLFVLFGTIHAQPPEEIWSQTYGGNQNEYLWCMVRTADGGFAISGNSFSVGAGRNDLWLVKTDGNGELEWSQPYGGAQMEWGADVVMTADGGFALGGMTFSYGPGIPNNPNFWLVKTDENGEMQWSEYYGSDLWEGASNMVVPFIQLSNGGFAIGGVRQVRYDQTISWDAALILTDENGEVQHDFGFGTVNGIDGFQEFIETEQGILCFGHTESWDRDNLDPWLVMINPEDGEEVWSNIIEIEEDQITHRAIQTANGGYVVVGAFIQNRGDYFDNGNDALMVRTDAEGEMLWYQRFGGDRCDFFTTLVELHNGAFAVVGWTSSFGAGNEDGWLILTDDLGDSLWSMPFGGQFMDLFDWIIEDENNDLYIAGAQTFQNSGGDYMLRKLSPPEFAFIEGYVIDAETEESLEDVALEIPNGRSTTSDSTGFYHLTYVWANDSVLTASVYGYNDLIIEDLELAVDETLEVNIYMTRPEIFISVEEFNETVSPNSSIERSFTISDSGTGVLEWSVERRLTGEDGVDLGTLRSSLQPDLNDPRLYGIVFIDGLYYVSGGGNDTNRVYVVNGNGDLHNSFPQFGESNFGMRDLAWDGELIWGCADGMVYGFTTNGELVREFEDPFTNSAITWDSDSSRLWIAGLRSDIVAYNSDGSPREDETLDNQGMRIKGLAYCPGDEAPLYVLCNPENDRHVIYKINPAVGDTIFVCELIPEVEGSPEGAFITNHYDTHGSFVLMNVVNNADIDRIDVWQLKANTDWMTLEPDEGVIQPDSSQELTLTLSTVGLDSTLDWEGELVFSKAVGGDDTVIPISMTISSTNSVRDNEPVIPSEFGISSIYPNPFNSMTTITYELDKSASTQLVLYDLSGRRVMTLFDGQREAGIHTAILNASNLPSGLYFVRLEALEKQFTRKIMLIR